MENKAESLARLKKLGLVAVIRGPSAELTLRLVDTLVRGGVTGIEITYTTPNAVEVVSKLHQQFGDAIMLGMGTLTEPRHAVPAVQAGATFLVSPGTEASLVQAMTATGLLTMAGALTPSEVMLAKRLGSDVIKVFPGSLTGPDYIKALTGPFPDLLFMPTGGVSAENVGQWFKAGVVAVGAGSELCPAQLIKDERFDEILTRAQRFVTAVEQARA
jgi:2-dehydro-3-deoxyphosphogluconate aldolase/(4S)-4-hydroxy-2-oxoglutarate aldolase